MLYSPKHFQQNDPTALQRFISAYPFATLISRNSFTVSHIALFYDKPQKRLLGHWAKANPQSKQINQEVLAIFQGPHGYISPRYYQTPQVPTWNYAVVHIQGICRTLPAKDNAIHIQTLFQQFEGSRHPFENMDEKKANTLLQAIVCFEVVELQWQGKFKMSQNKPEEMPNILASLSDSDRLAEQELADFMANLQGKSLIREKLDPN